MARIITYDGLASDEPFPDRGIVAGDSLSDVLVKLYYIDAMDEIVANCTVSAICSIVPTHIHSPQVPRFTYVTTEWQVLGKKQL